MPGDGDKQDTISLDGMSFSVDKLEENAFSFSVDKAKRFRMTVDWKSDADMDISIFGLDSGLFYISAR